MQWVDPDSLTSASRLDVFARTEFVRARLSGLGETWSRDLYRSFLVANEIDGKEVENGEKSTISQYFRAFERLIDSMQEAGFDLSKGCIPVSTAGIVNGAHRLATAMILGIPIAIESTDDPFGVYDYRWLDNRGIKSVFVESMAMSLLARSNNARATLIFDHQKNTIDELETQISYAADVVIRRRIHLSEIGKRRIIQLAYDHNDWWEDSRLEQMTAERFTSGDSHCDVIFTIERNLDTLQERKTNLRQLLPAGSFERTLHGTDHYFDTIYLAESLLNKNSVLFLNSAPIGSEARIMKLVGGPILSLEPSKHPRNWCIDGSAVLEIHGLRVAKDIDYLMINDSTIPKILLKNGDNHLPEYLHSKVRIDEIILDPRMHMIYKGIKFATLENFVARKFESKDINIIDIQLVVGLNQAHQSIYSRRDVQVKSYFQKCEFMVKAKLDKWLRKLPRRMENRIRQTIKNAR